MAQIPERVVNFDVYQGKVRLPGASTIDLPPIEMMTENISGAGIAGEVESVILGHTKSLSIKIAFRAITEAVLGLLAPVKQLLVAYGSIQLQDPIAGAIVTKQLRVECRGLVKSDAMGKLEPGKVMGSEIEMEIDRLVIDIEGVNYIEIDKFAQVFKVNGVDYLAKVRQDVGGI